MTLDRTDVERDIVLMAQEIAGEFADRADPAGWGLSQRLPNDLDVIDVRTVRKLHRALTEFFAAARRQEDTALLREVRRQR
jgi:hypothetical protein